MAPCEATTETIPGITPPVWIKPIPQRLTAFAQGGGTRYTFASGHDCTFCDVHTFDESRMSVGERRHITKRPDGLWQDKGEGATRARQLFPTQGEAEASAKDRLRQKPGGGEVIIHRPGGQIRDADTINRRDPDPPRDRKH